jgi:uncharacterized membrane protein YhhN
MVASWVLSAAAILSGAIYIWITYAGVQMQRFVFKPLTTALILGVALALPDAVSLLYRILIVVGILFSLAGDIFLLAPNHFVWGLVSFLIAHLFFVLGYVERAGVHMHWHLLTPFAFYGVALLYLLWPYVGNLRLPVLIYALVLLTMGWQATELWWGMRDLAALLAMFGAVLFVVSDSILAFDKFRAPIPHRDALIMSTYYGALLLIAWSVHSFVRG